MRPNKLVTNQYLRMPTAKSSSDPVKLGCSLLVMATRLAIVGRSATRKAKQMSITVTVPVALEAWLTTLPTNPITFDGETDLSCLSNAASSKPNVPSHVISWV